MASGAGTARPPRSRALTLLLPSTTLAFPLTPLCLKRKINSNSQYLGNTIPDNGKKWRKETETNLLASSLNFITSISLVGGHFGKLDGSQAYGSVVKNCKQRQGTK